MLSPTSHVDAKLWRVSKEILMNSAEAMENVLAMFLSSKSLNICRHLQKELAVKLGVFGIKRCIAQLEKLQYFHIFSVRYTYVDLRVIQ